VQPFWRFRVTRSFDFDRTAGSNFHASDNVSCPFHAVDATHNIVHREPLRWGFLFPFVGIIFLAGTPFHGN
jgi:hypothetical protein